MKIITKYTQRVIATDSLLCVGLDSAFEALPSRFKKEKHPQFEFNRWIIDQTHQFTAAYKPNAAFYEARGNAGWGELQMTIEYLRHQYPEIMTILDAKRADIGSTNEGYVKGIFDVMGFDAVTLHPYLGQEALKPFLERDDKACIILCKTSNPGSGEIQDLEVRGRPLWQHVASEVASKWNTNQNCILVAGATYPKQLAVVREIVGEMTLLIPGIGTQGGEVEPVLQAGLNSSKQGLIISASRSIIFASDPAIAAEDLKEQITKIRTALLHRDKY
ncbi:MAG: orotidine-5'-phosphate decarboxylase [bacterium]|nr:orotidine-5'-phosphate decarboxylase [bacterium]